MAKRSFSGRLKRLSINLLAIGLAASLAACASYGLRWLGY
jgi:hypothetical protein